MLRDASESRLSGASTRNRSGRLRAEEEAERQRVQAELARLRAEAEATRLRSEEELGRRQVIQPEVAASLVDQSDVKGIVPVEESSVAPESLIERNDGTASGWIEVDTASGSSSCHTHQIRPLKKRPRRGTAELS